MSAELFDALEGRDPAQREAALMAALPAQIAHAQASSPAYAELLAGVDAMAVRSRDALARLPLTRKSSLAAAQAARRALRLGGFAAGLPRRIFQSPGGLYEPEPDADAADPWRVARALHAAGIRAGELVHVSYSFHLTPAGAMMEAGARALGAACFPAASATPNCSCRRCGTCGPKPTPARPAFCASCWTRPRGRPGEPGAEPAPRAGQRRGLPAGAGGLVRPNAACRRCSATPRPTWV